MNEKEMMRQLTDIVCTLNNKIDIKNNAIIQLEHQNKFLREVNEKHAKHIAELKSMLPLWDGKVKCIMSTVHYWVEGEVYDITNGTIIDEEGTVVEDIRSLSDINDENEVIFEVYKPIERFVLRCTNSVKPWWTEGEEYDVINGCIIDDDGDRRFGVHNVSDVEYISGCKFERVKNKTSTNTFKVICTEGNNGWWITGNVYDVTDGVIVDSEGDRRYNITTVDDLRVTTGCTFRVIDENTPIFYIKNVNSTTNRWTHDCVYTVVGGVLTDDIGTTIAYLRSFNDVVNNFGDKFILVDKEGNPL